MINKVILTNHSFHPFRNLEAAVCAYFDHDGSNNALSPFPFIKLPAMTFTPSDNNFVDRIPVNTPFFYHCIITNSGRSNFSYLLLLC